MWGGDANSVSYFSIVGNVAQVASGTTSYSAVLGPVATDAEVLFSGSLSSYNNTNIGSVLRWNDGNNWYKAYIDGNNLIIQKKVNGTTTIIASTPFAATAGTTYSLRFRVVGNTLYARAWAANGTEPTNWMATATDGNFQSGYCGLRMLVQGSGVTASFTNFQAVSLA